MTAQTYQFFTVRRSGWKKSVELELFMRPEMSPGPAVPRPSQDARLREVAMQLEATFLSEMLKSAGVGAVSESFGGGVGEEQFGSYLRDAQAREMVKAGGIGLAQSLFEAMQARGE